MMQPFTKEYVSMVVSEGFKNFKKKISKTITRLPMTGY